MYVHVCTIYLGKSQNHIRKDFCLRNTAMLSHSNCDIIIIVILMSQEHWMHRMTI